MRKFEVSMKKLISLILTIALVFTMAVPALAVNVAEYTFTAEVNGGATANVTVGDTVTVTLTLTKGDEALIDLYMFQDYVTFDTAYAEIVEDSIVAGVTVDSAYYRDYSSDDLGYVYAQRSTRDLLYNVANDTVLVTFDLKILKAGTITIGHDTTEVIDEFGTAQTVATVDAVITATSSSGSSVVVGGVTEEETETAVAYLDGNEVALMEIAEVDGIMTAYIDSAELAKEMYYAESGSDLVVTVDAEEVAVVFTLYDLELMQDGNINLLVIADGVEYYLRIASVDTEPVWDELSVVDSKLVPVTVTITRPDLGSLSLIDGVSITTPVDIELMAEQNGELSEMYDFSLYLYCTVELTAAEYAMATTALAVDGDQYHVPTKVYEEDGKYYAEIHSHSNGMFVLIYNEESYADADGQWYEDTVNEMGSRKIVNGKSDDAFAGSDNITRAEFAAILVRALGYSDVGTSDFSDVSDTDWYAGAVGKAYELGLVTGRTDGTFDPNAAITREEAMAMIMRAAAISELDSTFSTDLSAFTDTTSISDWALESVQFNVSNGLIVGSDGLLRPSDTITRAETATVVLRLLRNSDLVDVR